jgi:hypothetical protein
MGPCCLSPQYMKVKQIQTPFLKDCASFLSESNLDYLRYSFDHTEAHVYTQDSMVIPWHRCTTNTIVTISKDLNAKLMVFLKLWTRIRRVSGANIALSSTRLFLITSILRTEFTNFYIHVIYKLYVKDLKLYILVRCFKLNSAQREFDDQSIRMGNAHALHHNP